MLRDGSDIGRHTVRFEPAGADFLVRIAVDILEGIVSDELWPLPTYQEMLFIK